MTATIPDDVTIIAAENILSTELHGEAVLLDLDSGIYYGSNDVGAYIWEVLQEPQTVSDLQEAVLAEYDVTASRCRRDIQSFLRKMAAENLIDVRDDRSL